MNTDPRVFCTPVDLHEFLTGRAFVAPPYPYYDGTWYGLTTWHIEHGLAQMRCGNGPACDWRILDAPRNWSGVARGCSDEWMRWVTPRF